MGAVAEATEAAIDAAGHLTAMDVGALAALRALAQKIDTDDDIREAYLDYQVDQGHDPIRPLQLDNVSIPTYLKYCEALGLSPAGRDKLKDRRPEAAGGKLGKLRAVPKPKAG